MRLSLALAAPSAMRYATLSICGLLLGCEAGSFGQAGRSLPAAARAEIERGCKEQIKSWPVPVDPRARPKSEKARDELYQRCLAQRSAAYGKK